jgi:hypothetical protein
MSRKLRLEFPGAIYHVINRGNYRTWIFADATTRSTLLTYRHSSYWYLHRKNRPAFLHPATALAASCGLTDSTEGRQAYARYLVWQAAEEPAGRNEAYR